MASATLLSALLLVDWLTASWSRRRVPGVFVLAAVGLLGGGVPVGAHAGAWLTGGVLTALTLVAAYVTLLRFDLTIVPVVIATMTAAGALAAGRNQVYPGQLAGAFCAAALSLIIGWWWFRAFRRQRHPDGHTRPAG